MTLGLAVVLAGCGAGSPAKTKRLYAARKAELNALIGEVERCRPVQGQWRPPQLYRVSLEEPEPVNCRRGGASERLVKAMRRADVEVLTYFEPAGGLEIDFLVDRLGFGVSGLTRGFKYVSTGKPPQASDASEIVQPIDLTDSHWFYFERD